MKKLLICLLITMLTIFGLTACGSSSDEGTIIDDENSEVTIYANGGTIWMGEEEPYESELGAYAIAPGVTIGEGIMESISSVEKEGSVFSGWMIYAVSDGEWVTEEVTDLADGQLCVACGGYGYYLMNEYEVVSESASTEDMLNYAVDGRDYYVLAIWE